jgi:hypothetical protein
VGLGAPRQLSLTAPLVVFVLVVLSSEESLFVQQELIPVELSSLPLRSVHHALQGHTVLVECPLSVVLVKLGTIALSTPGPPQAILAFLGHIPPQPIWSTLLNAQIALLARFVSAVSLFPSIVRLAPTPP